MYEVYAGLLKEDIQLTIDGQRISCPPESSILEAERAYYENEEPIRIRFKEQSAEDLL